MRILRNTELCDLACNSLAMCTSAPKTTTPCLRWTLVTFPHHCVGVFTTWKVWATIVPYLRLPHMQRIPARVHNWCPNSATSAPCCPGKEWCGKPLVVLPKMLRGLFPKLGNGGQECVASRMPRKPEMPSGLSWKQLECPNPVNKTACVPERVDEAHLNGGLLH